MTKNSSVIPVTRFISSLVLLTVFSSCAFRSNSNTSSISVQKDPSPNQNSQVTVKSPLPPPTGFVNDYAHIFDPESKKQLESVLTELKDKTQIEFAVVTVETTGDQSIYDYSLAVARGWGIGPKDTSKGGGLLLLLALKSREWRLQVSRSLEKDLPDDVTKKLGDESIGLYRQGKYAEGLRKYVDSIIRRLKEVRKDSQ